MTQTKFKLNRKALFGLMVLAAIGATQAHAATINVTSFTDAIANDGVCSLREAVIAANGNAVSGAAAGECVAGESTVADVISLPAGTYVLSLSGPDEVEDTSTVGVLDVLNTPNPAIGDLDITESVTIAGVGSATTTIQWADQAVRDRIFHVNAATGTIEVAITGVKLTHGQTNQVDLGVGPVSGSGPLATNYWLRRAGGALAVGSAAAVVLIDPNVTGQANSEGRGGSQKPASPDEGGATFKLTLNDVVVDGNAAEGDGGGIYNAAPMTATFTIVNNNNALTNGGGVYNEGDTSITNSTVSNNTAEGGGGVFMTGSNTVNISGSTLSGNRAVGGGGISARAGMTLKLVNSTLSGNIGSDVGAGLYTNGSAQLNFVTIANNLAGADSPTAGSGINVYPASTAANTVTLKNVLLSANKKGWLDGMDAAAIAALLSANCGVTGGGIPVTSSGNNLSSDASCDAWLTVATDKKSVDPKIGDLLNNGGLTLTHALLAGSPALGAGAADATVTVDQRGVTRETPPDIGAFEFVTPAAPATTTSSGGGGGGCTIGGNGRFDPSLPALLAAGLGFFGWRRFKAGNK